MRLSPTKPQKALNQAFRKVKPYRDEVEAFKENLRALIDAVDEVKDEENLKTEIRDFLKKTYFGEDHYFNVKANIDWAIFNGPKSSDSVGVIMEAKRPGNKAEMVKIDDLNRKAFHELMLYYLRERISEKNIEIKHLIITNVHEWFIFDAQVFEKLFAQNKGLVKKFEDFEAGRLGSGNTSFFYNDIAKNHLNELEAEISFTHFNLEDYQSSLKPGKETGQTKLIHLYKVLSAEHLLKLPFANDSNSLNRDFYVELLHIIGLEETKQGGKKIIGRKAKGARDEGSLLENAIRQLDKRDLLYEVENPTQYGATKEDQLFGVGLELVITWVNRVLFLKLLEAQLINYHQDKAYSFLDTKHIANFDDLDSLFFDVLAKNYEERGEEALEKFSHVPYLNSSLFEPNKLEKATLFVSNLRDERALQIGSKTVLTDSNGKKRKGQLSTIEYLFEFLNAYDFSSEGSEAIQEEKKTLINASVLGLIFEKINGYKDGSFFTPGFITMYMCRETIRRAVLQKFNDYYGWELKEFDQLYDKIEDKEQANALINSLKICDPAVGSGHFLVSALNEIIAIKSELKILVDREGKTLRDYTVEVVNDELIVKVDEEFFAYNPKSAESQRVQETLFHEKQTLIENCLFGVDINPNSVKICRLRLWIELLKSAYYKTSSQGRNDRSDLPEGDLRVLETLPNIDINIKTGNSLISRFGLEEDLSGILKSVKWDIEAYKGFVRDYKQARGKEEKYGLEKLINQIKNDFRTEIHKNDPKIKRKSMLAGQLYNLTQTGLFEETKAQKKKRLKELEKVEKALNKLSKEIEEIKSNKIFENAFEWRFEFPEVLSDNGDFLGFDVVIGNPPYVRVQKLDSSEVDFYFEKYQTPSGKLDISILFFERALKIAKKTGVCCYISSSQWMQTDNGFKIRELLSDNRLTKLIDFGSLPVFEEADTYPAIFLFNETRDSILDFGLVRKKHELNLGHLTNLKFHTKELKTLSGESWVFSEFDLLSHLSVNQINFTVLGSIGSSYIGLLTGLDKAFVVPNSIMKSSVIESSIVFPYAYRGEEIKSFSNVRPESSVIYPYTRDSFGSETLLSEEDLKESFPKTFDHLSQFYDILVKRKDSRKLYAQGHNWFRHLRRGSFDLIKCKKLLVKGVAKKMQVGLLEDNTAFNGANCPAIVLESKDLSEEYLLGLLNSSIITYFMNGICPRKLSGYFRYNAKSIVKIPVVLPSESQKLQIESKVSEILVLKKEDPAADTTTLEAEIDLMVYKLYKLTYEEVKIVDPEFGMSEGEYDKIDL